MSAMTTATMAKKVAAPHLAVIDGGGNKAQGEPEVGSPAWAEELQADAVRTVENLERGYLHLGRLLYLAESTRVGGLEHGPCVVTIFGEGQYKSLDEWASKGLGIHERKARSLVRIYKRIGVELSAMDEGLRMRILGLGWTKVREVVRVLTLKNAAEWADRGETLNYHDFRGAVASYADALQKKQIDAGLAAAKVSAAEVAAGSPEGAEALGFGGGLPMDASAIPAPFAAGAEFGASASDDEEDDGTDGVPIPDPEKTIPFNFALYPNQAQTLRDALQMAESHNPGKPKSYYLEVVALEYISNYFNGATPLEKKAVAIARLGELMGLRIVAQDEETGLLVHGAKGTLAQSLRAGMV